MNTIRISLILGIASFLPSCTGYLHGKPVLTGEEADVVSAGIAQTQFSDIPVPGGFEMQRRGLESYGTQIGSFRAGHLVYHGEASVSDAAAYLRNRLPEHGWMEASHADLPSGALQIVFQKGPHTATISIAREETKTSNGPQNNDFGSFFTKLLIDVKTGKGS